MAGTIYYVHNTETDERSRIWVSDGCSTKLRAQMVLGWHCDLIPFATNYNRKDFYKGKGVRGEHMIHKVNGKFNVVRG